MSSTNDEGFEKYENKLFFFVLFFLLLNISEEIDGVYEKKHKKIHTKYGREKRQRSSTQFVRPVSLIRQRSRGVARLPWSIEALYLLGSTNVDLDLRV